MRPLKSVKYSLEAIVIGVLFIQANHEVIVRRSQAQSIGFQPQFNLGFNPYLSPVYGYGLGLPFGAYNYSPLRYPSLLNTLPGGSFADNHGFMGKVHAKAFFKKLALGQSGLYQSFGNFKDKLNVLKHPGLAFTPYGTSYGYGKHYGAALVPNNPYKSVYSDYYDMNHSIKNNLVSSPTTSYGHRTVSPSVNMESPENIMASTKSYAHLKPLVKVGALLTTAAILGKKALENQIRLNPAGMILSSTQP